MSKQGGENAKEVTPLGYCGNSSNINLKDATGFIKVFSDITARLIKNTL
ncbi:hypothetical protein [Vallitalea guaymasensis]|nr:hypothetical protein [Vallitalea guaymasensis]